jgi:hypothetical protein
MSEEKWIFVEPAADYRPTCIPDFNEPSGPTFSVSERAIPSDFYKKMLPDSLFNHIVECTNIRAKRHFANGIIKNDKSWCEVR